jgi:hypothetical protein
MCVPLGMAGDPCGGDNECASGFCPMDDGVCCDAACGLQCESCLMVDTGLASDGLCGPVLTGTDPLNECALDLVTCRDANCGGVAGECAPLAAGSVCRASLGLCDPEEQCDGTNVCPNDVLLANGATCRMAGGVCDITELCDGVSPACPADAKVIAGTVCNPSNGSCDIPESCDGNNVNCPSDVLLPDNVQSLGGVCDPYLCNGMIPGCPLVCAAPVDCLASKADSCNSTVCQCGTNPACTGSQTCVSGACM